MTTVLVTGATGNVGQHVVSALRSRGVSVRAFMRDAGKATATLGPAVELAIGDFDDPASLRRALQGIDRVFLTAADGPRKVDHENAVIDAAAAAWVQRIVKLSGPRVEIGSELAFMDWHGRIEQHLRSSGVPAIFLRGSFFMSNLLASADAIRHTGTLYAPAGDAKVAMIDPQDIGAAAAALLTEDGHDGNVYAATGPEAITFADVADQLSTATCRDIQFVSTPDDAAHAAILNSGAPQWLADNLIGLFGQLRQGAGAEVTDTVQALTGRAPRTFGDWALDHAAAFGR